MPFDQCHNRIHNSVNRIQNALIAIFVVRQSITIDKYRRRRAEGPAICTQRSTKHVLWIYLSNIFRDIFCRRVHLKFRA